MIWKILIKASAVFLSAVAGKIAFLENDGDLFWLAEISMSERIDSPYLTPEEIDRIFKIDW